MVENFGRGLEIRRVRVVRVVVVAGRDKKVWALARSAVGANERVGVLSSADVEESFFGGCKTVGSAERSDSAVDEGLEGVVDGSRHSDTENPSGGSKPVADEPEDAPSVVESSDKVLVEIFRKFSDEGGSGEALGVASKAQDQIAPGAWDIGDRSTRRTNDNLGGRGCWRGVRDGIRVREGWEVGTRGARGAFPQGGEVAVLLVASEGV